MKLEKEQRVKLLFKNGLSIEGFIDSWVEGNYILRSLDGESLLIIQSPDEDIMAVKVMLHMQPAIKENPEKTASQPEEPPSEQELRIRKLAELRLEAAAEERRIISSKLKDHHIGDVRKVGYGLPGFLKKPSSQ
jgi:hypothetical protein